MTLSIHSPDEMVAVIPHLLGFKPEESIVFVPMSPNLSGVIVWRSAHPMRTPPHEVVLHRPRRRPSSRSVAGHGLDMTPEDLARAKAAKLTDADARTAAEFAATRLGALSRGTGARDTAAAFAKCFGHDSGT